MKKLNKEEMRQVQGGVSYTSTINAVIKVITTLFGIGQAIGSAIRRATSSNYCKV